MEKKYIEIVKELDWPNPFESSATEAATEVSGKTGVKMTGPYDWVPPNYWLLDKTRGGAHGFNSETGPGPAIPPIESLRKMLPEDHLWPVNSWWDYHAGGGAFKDLKSLHHGAERALRAVERRGGIRAQGAGDGLRRPSRHVRGFRPE